MISSARVFSTQRPKTLADRASARNLVADARARLDADAIPERDRHIELAADMHYKGQAFELTVPLRSLQLDEAALSV